MELSVAAVLVLGGLVLLRWALVLFGAMLILRAVHECPACFREETFLIRRPVIAILLPMVEWRWCPVCRWQGPSLREERRGSGVPTSGVPTSGSPTT